MAKAILCQEVRESCSLCVHIYIFSVVAPLEIFFAHGPIKLKWSLNRLIRYIDRTVTSTAILDQSGPGSNDNEGALRKSPEVEAHHQTQFRVLTHSLEEVLWHIKHCWLFNAKYVYIIFCTLLNSFKYCYVSLTIQLNINHLFARS